MVQLTEKQKNELKDMLLEYLNGDEIESSGITHILNRFFPAESRVYTKDSFGKQDYKILIATGAGKADEAMEVKVGDTVLYNKYAGSEVEVENKKYLIMSQNDILVIL